jgi:hypothetical protein
MYPDVRDLIAKRGAVLNAPRTIDRQDSTSIEMKHALWQLMEKQNKTEADRVACAAVMALSTREGFTHMTPEQVFDALIVNWDETLAFARET